MRTGTLSFETWRVTIKALHAKGLPSMGEHADRLELQLAPHPTGELIVSLDLTEDGCLRSCNWARWQMGIPLPVEQ